MHSQSAYENDLKHRQTNIDSSNTPILHRALSTVSANQTLVNTQRNLLAKNYRRISVNDEIVTIDHNDADASFILPNLYDLPEHIRIRLMDNLVDTPTMISLEETKRLNWWVKKRLPCPKLYPLVTSGDGNCLLHATSLAMWGFHDHSLSMRKALNETLITSKPNNSLYRRWRWSQSVQNKKYGLVFSEQEWNDEWKNLLRLSSIEPRISNSSMQTSELKDSSRQYYESLEEFHVYVLANNIRRPIIIYSDTILRTNNGEAISPIEFGGIYLPLEIPSEKCHKQPIFLAFDAAHFSALVPMEEINKTTSKVTYRIPLIDIDTLDLLPIHFFIDPGLNFQWPIDKELSDEKINFYKNSGETRMNILEKYLNLSKDYLSLKNFIPNNEQNSSIDQVNNSTNKKPSRSSFSKIIRRTFIQPFSSTKRSSTKHNHQSNSSDIRVLNPHTNILTIILTNFQPKRPKTSDNMIKNYIDTYFEEYHQEITPKQINKSIDDEIRRRLLNRQMRKPCDFDDNEDSLPMENGQFSMNINYIQRKSNDFTQNNSHEMTNDQHHYLQSHINLL